MDKKGILGLDTVKAFLLAIMVIAIFVIVTMLVLVTLRTSVDSADLSSSSATNESIARPTTAGISLAANSLRNPVCGAISNVYNGSSSVLIAAGNYTQTNCVIVNATDVSATATTWRVTYSYTYDQPYTTNVVDNISAGGTKFFAQVPTFFVLLGVVVFILIIAIIIVVVSRFGIGQNIESM